MNALDNHMKNLSIIAGHPVTRYEYLMNTDDLTKAYMQSHRDLSYALYCSSVRFSGEKSFFAAALASLLREKSLLDSASSTNLLK